MSKPEPTRAAAIQAVKDVWARWGDYDKEFILNKIMERLESDVLVVEPHLAGANQFQSADENALHIAICQAVALLNRTVNDDEQRQAHNILRVALDNYGRLPGPPEGEQS